MTRRLRQPRSILRDHAEVLEHLLEEVVALEHRVVDDREECLARNPLHDRPAQECLPGADLAGDDNQRFASPERVGELLESRGN